MPDRRYDQKELAAIFRSAAEAQAKESAREKDGLTLEEIQKVAGEVGIDPQHIVAAAQSLGMPTDSGFRLGGKPYREVFERNLDGEISEHAWSEIVDDLRATFGSAGHSTVVGSSREWSDSTDYHSVHFSARQKNGRTKVRLTVQHQSLILGWMGLIFGSLFGSIIGGALTYKNGGTPLMTIGVILAIVSTIAIVTHWGLKSAHSHSEKNIAGFLERLRQHAQETSTPEIQPASTTEDVVNRLSQQQ